MGNLFSGLSDKQIQKILVAEHGGINESFANIYAITSDEAEATSGKEKVNVKFTALNECIATLIRL